MMVNFITQGFIEYICWLFPRWWWYETILICLVEMTYR